MNLLPELFTDDNGTSWNSFNGQLQTVDAPAMIPGHPILCQMNVTANGTIWRYNKRASIPSEYFFTEFTCYFSPRGGTEIYAVTDEGVLIRISLKKNTKVEIAKGISHVIEAFDFVENAEVADLDEIEEAGDYVGASHVLAIDDEGYWVIVPLVGENTKIARQAYVSTELLRRQDGYVITREGAYYIDYLENGMTDLVLIPNSDGIIDVNSTVGSMGEDEDDFEEFKVSYFLDRGGNLSELEDGKLVEINNPDLEDLNEDNQWIQLLHLLDGQMGLVNTLGEVYLYIPGEAPELTDIPDNLFGFSASSRAKLG